MQRIAIAIQEELLATGHTIMQRLGYASRPEALCDMIRDAAVQEAASAAATRCIAVLSCVQSQAALRLARATLRALALLGNDRRWGMI
jgi:metal-responsive CopG/Arc/MetJ family transcriptional regulator